MKKLFLLLIVFNSMIANAQQWLSAISAGGTGVDRSRSIYVEASGNVYVTGIFEGASITFGNTTLTNKGIGNIFIVKYDQTGNVIWAKSIGGSVYDEAYSICADLYGDIFITGYFTSSTIAFGSINLSCKGGEDIFVAKYDSLGNILWAKSAGGNGYDEGNQICTDASGNIYVTGQFESSSITFGNSTLTNNNSSGATNDIFIVKYDPLGNTLWAKNEGGTSDDWGKGIGINSSGNIYITGKFYSSTLIIGNSTLTNIGGYTDLFIAKYDSLGNALWAKSAGENEYDEAIAICTDNHDNAIITGWFGGDSLTFGNITLNSSGSSTMFIAKYDSLGNVSWAKADGCPNKSIIADINGNVYVTGGYSGSPTFGNDTLAMYGSFCIVKYDSSGNAQWARSVGESGGSSFWKDYSTCVAVDTNGKAYLTGYFENSSLEFGNISVTNVNTGSADIFVATIGDATTDIKEGKGSINESIKIYPNPSNGNIRLVCPNNIDEIKISDVLGQIIYSAKPNEKNLSLQIDKGGIYFVTVTSNEKTALQKLVVQY